MRIVLLGPPGAGKGTQGARLAERLSAAYLASGDLLREAVDRGDAVGQEAKRYMESGALVPDALVLGLLLERIGRLGKGAPFILDGFPRTEAQARALEERLAREGERSLDLVVDFETSDGKVIERLAGRRICRECGAIYHLRNLPPQREGQCDRCGGALQVRTDDQPETVRRRLAVYRRETRPLLAYYRSQGKLRTVQGDLEVEDQYRALEELLRREKLLGWA